jgi:hypothetical protein
VEVVVVEMVRVNVVAIAMLFLQYYSVTQPTLVQMSGTMQISQNTTFLMVCIPIKNIVGLLWSIQTVSNKKIEVNLRLHPQ